MFTSFPFAFWRGADGGGDTGFGFRYGYQFDGVDESINFGNVLDLDGSSAFSFSFWIKRDITTAEAFISKTTGSFDGFMIYSNGGGGLNSFLFYIGVNSSNTIQVQTTFPEIPDNKWMHCVVTYDGSKNASGVNVYINNSLRTLTVLRDTFTGSSSVSSDFIFGRFSSIYFYEGRLDDVQFYDLELNSTQVSDIYNSGYVTAPTASPTHHWKLGEEDTFSTNWTVKDSIGSLDGTSVNMEEEDRKLGVAYSMDFDGVDEKINFGNILDFATNEAYSISFWFKTSTSLQYMFGNYSSIAPKSGYSFFTISSKVRFFINNNGSGIYVGTTNGYNSAEWNHILVTYDGSENESGVEMYLNGVKETLTTHGTTTVNPYTSTGNDLVLGANSANNTFIYNGNLMEVSVFDSELSAADAALLYNTTGTNNGVPIDPRDVGLSPTFFAPLVGPNDSFSTNWTITDEINGNNGTSVNMEEADKTSDTP